MCESRHHSTPLCDQGRALHSRVAPHPCDADFGALLLICEVFFDMFGVLEEFDDDSRSNFTNKSSTCQSSQNAVNGCKWWVVLTIRP